MTIRAYAQPVSFGLPGTFSNSPNHSFVHSFIHAFTHSSAIPSLNKHLLSTYYGVDIGGTVVNRDGTLPYWSLPPNGNERGREQGGGWGSFR